jgi:hypothetical protein
VLHRTIMIRFATRERWLSIDSERHLPTKTPYSVREPRQLLVKDAVYQSATAPATVPPRADPL